MLLGEKFFEKNFVSKKNCWGKISLKKNFHEKKICWKRNFVGGEIL